MLTLGGYGDRVVYDVVPMEALHLLLGRHWPFGKKVIHDGITNRFTFIHLGQRVILKSLSPRELNKKESKSEVKKRKERGKEKVGEKSKSVREKEQKKKKENNECKRATLDEVRKVLLAKRELLFTLPIDMPLHVSPSLNA
ncbi:hypothetical protein CR513_29529, partial [Mucuna pruriens]